MKLQPDLHVNFRLNVVRSLDDPRRTS